MGKQLYKLTFKRKNEILSDSPFVEYNPIKCKIEGVEAFSIDNGDDHLINIPEGEYRILLSNDKSNSYYNLRIYTDLTININYDSENGKIEMTQDLFFL
jgi:hypothetical protein